MAKFEERCTAVVFHGLHRGELLTFMEHPMRDRFTVQINKGEKIMGITLGQAAYAGISGWSGLGLEVHEPEPVEEAFRIAGRVSEERIVPFPLEEEPDVREVRMREERN